MTFTYAGTLTTDLDFIRFKINDTVSGSGPKPSGGNFTDEEIAGLLDIEGNKYRTVAGLYETLGAIWANYVDAKIGPRDEKLSQKSDNYLALAKQWRAEYGTPSSATVLSTGFVTRQDAYSDDISAETYTSSGIDD